MTAEYYIIDRCPQHNFVYKKHKLEGDDLFFFYSPDDHWLKYTEESRITFKLVKKYIIWEATRDYRKRLMMEELIG